ncbi:hypothetical protein niasHT_029926 [Heterodera trifolii]|uniref:Uncharacterized protein n=1 Tax=Heterodera trifolii TaxID=157864 RepID=A0ABD2K4B1_9BILA
MLFLSFPSFVLRQIRPSFCRCFSFLLMLAMLFDLISSGRSLPLGPTNERIFFSKALRRPNKILLQLATVPPPMFQFDGFIELDKHWQKLGFVHASRKYDRNCFFSPVQCMLLFRDGSKLKDSQLFRHFSQPKNPFSLYIFSHILKPKQSFKPRNKPRRN